MLLEGDKGGKQLEGVAMKGTIARRFEELDWDNNGQAWCLTMSCAPLLFVNICCLKNCHQPRETALTTAHQHQSPAQ